MEKEISSMIPFPCWLFSVPLSQTCPLQLRVLGSKFDEGIDVSGKRRAANVVWFEHGLGLRGIVSLFDEKIGHADPR
jgi:hypothetical protein